MEKNERMTAVRDLRIEIGKKLIYPQNIEKWIQRNMDRSEIYVGYSDISTDIALMIMEVLENGVSIPEAVAIFKSLTDMNKTWASDAMSVIFNFCKKGVEFCETAKFYPESEATVRLLEAKRQENMRFAAELDPSLKLAEAQVPGGLAGQDNGQVRYSAQAEELNPPVRAANPRNH